MRLSNITAHCRRLRPDMPPHGPARAFASCLPAAAGYGLLALLITGALTCSRMENPYLERSRCRIAISGPRADGDTLSIFAPQRFTVELLLQAHVTGFTFSADSNYTWSARDSAVAQGQFGDAWSFPFTVAFSDTGWKTLRAVAELDDGSTISDSIRLRCISPLDQPDIIGDVGQPVRLWTTPVPELMALYVWKFGAGDSVWSDQPSQTWYMDRILSGTGQLYVRLLGRTIRSPAHVFRISMADQTPPTIECLNDGAHGVDKTHINAGVPPFFFQAEIRDNTSSLKLALVNGAAFDQIDTVNPRTWKCIREFSTLAPAGDSLEVVVSAKDAYDNESSKKFWIHYDSSIVVRPALVISEPANDSVVVSKRLVTVRGTATDIYGYDSLFVFFVNAGGDSAPRVITPAAAQWQWACELPRDITTLVFALAAPLSGSPAAYDTLDSAAITVIFDAAAIDATDPVIDTVYAGATPIADGHQTATSPLSLTVRPFDQSGIAHVTFNGAPAAHEGNNAWTAEVPLVHTTAGNIVLIAAEDSAGNQGDASRVIYLNNSPRITRMPNAIYATVGEPYTDTVRATDADGDPLTVSVRIFADSGAVVLEPDAGGSFTWIPNASDTGNTDVLVQVSDGYPKSTDSTCRIMVRAPAPGIRKARFLTTAADFPETLTVGQPWVFTLRIDMPPDSGDYLFTAQIAGAGEYLLNQTTDNVIRWTPTLQQVGVQTLRVTVHSSSDSADSIIPQPQIAVVAPQPWSVKFSTASSTVPEGGGSHTIRVEINRPSNGTISIGYGVQWGQGTTADSSDFTLPVSRRLAFPQGDSIAFLTLTITDDAVPEVPEYVTLKLADPLPQDMVIRSPSTHQVTIKDNDTALVRDTVTIATADAFGSEASVVVPVTIQARAPLGKDVQLRIIPGGTAQQGNFFDYSVNPVDFIMRRGASTATVNLSINDDALCEPVTEFIVLTLRAATPEVMVQDSLFVYGILPSDSAQCNRIVAFVCKQKPMTTLEKAVVDTIGRMGYTVYPLARDELKYADLLAFDAAILSGSLGDRKLGDSLSGLAVPILSASPEATVGLGLAPGASSDTGAALGQNLEVAAAMRLWTRTRITTADVNIPWAHPAMLSDVVARVPPSFGGSIGPPNEPAPGSDTTRAAIFHVSPGQSGTSLGPSARRCVFPMCRSALNGGDAVEYTLAWWMLLKASVEWTIFGAQVLPLSKLREGP